MRAPRRAAAAGALAAALAVAGCGTGAPAPGTVSGTAPGTASGTGQITVLAAASLTDVFTTVAARVEADHPGTAVTLSFAASSELVEQVRAGAPADVLATADTATMAAVVGEGLAGGERVFATNQLQIAVPAGNPGGVDGLADLARGAEPDLLVALCAAQVPCGAAADELFAAAGLTAAPDTYEQDVRAVLTKVALGEVDAGLVYRSEVVAGGAEVEGIEVPQAAQAQTEDVVAVLEHAPNPELAAAFVEAVTGPYGRQVLAEAGFGRP